MRAFAAVSAALIAGTHASPQWEAFKSKHGKTYANNAEEEVRQRVFEANMEAARQLSAKEPLAEFGATPFADLTPEEFAVYHSSAGFYTAASRKGLAEVDSFTEAQVAAAAATSVDWRTKGAVTAVKNQAQCGSCWAFSTTGNVEGQWFLAGNKLTALSEQQLVSCDKGFGDQGCMGGLPTNAYKYIVSAGGLETEEAYPYKSTLPISFGKCKFDKSKIAATITGGQTLKGDEGQMLAWMQKNGPVSIGVNAAGSTWQLYKGGIVKNCAAKQPDHGVLIVGYGSEAGTAYWIVKNSWASSWGEEGYIRLEYGTNQCNIVSAPSSSVVSKSSKFEAFKAAHGKVYSNAEEEQLRRNVFEANMKAAEEMKLAEPHAEFGASPFADLTEAEFATYHSAGAFFAAANGTALKAAKTFSASAVAAAEATAVDWRQKGAVTAVKDQGQCGSCWAFSTTGNIEGQWFLAGNKLTSVSEQQLVSCDKGFGDEGCNGGLPSNAYKYIVSAGGLETESAYPYSGTGASCKFSKSKVAVKISNGITLKSDEGQMLTWMQQNGPVSIGVNAAGLKWQLYRGGIVKTCKVKQPDHGVLIVGYGTDASAGAYWVVKNSWGASWGEEGYIRLQYGSNQCNIVDTPTSAQI